MLMENDVEKCSTIAYALNLECERVERKHEGMESILKRIESLV